jgi:hypothetical protein
VNWVTVLSPRPASYRGARRHDAVRQGQTQARDALWSALRAAWPELRIQFAFDEVFHLAKLVASVGTMRPGPVDGVVSEARDDVPVAMIDGLAGGLAIVDDHVQPVGTRGRADGSAQPGQERADRGSHGLRKLAQMSVMSPGHEQRVAAIDRINVEKGHGVGRLEHFGRGDRAFSDLAEYAVRIVRWVAQ